MNPAISFAVRSSLGISINHGPPKFSCNDLFEAVRSKSCRTMLFSPAGDYFAYVNGLNLHLLQTEKWKTIAVIENTKSYHLSFSPKGTYLCAWEPFATNNANPQGSPNLNIYESESGKLVKNFVHKKQTNWEPQWSADEVLFSRLVDTDIVFYNSNDFQVINRVKSYKVMSYTISPNVENYFVVLHTQDGKGQPAIGRLFKYPMFEHQQSIANKSFFQSDKVEFYWSAKATHVLLLTMTEVDKTSYYGKQGLHFISTSGDTAMVTMNKEGPIYNVAWSPRDTEFCVVYGFMPSRCTIFNLKCEMIHQFSAAPRNSIYYNPQGNILLTAGFGNLRGHIELWDIASKKLIGSCEAADSTLLQWSPDGTHFLTATTAPRLRIGNGYKVWHYSGALIHEHPYKENDELYDVAWQKAPKDAFKEPAVNFQKVEGIVSNQPQASKEAYRPPSARNRPPITFKLHDDDSDGQLPPAAPSKAALKQKKKRENKKARKQQEEPNSNPPITSTVSVILTEDEEKNKKIKNIKRKLDAIGKLKDQQSQGKVLEVNQLAKIKSEDELMVELKKLQL
ncbi:hypothetical protein PPYR_04445 [Photinus pyralis]|uniref:Eukaryotic translation initiation factor 2A n=1 Tax=Photinus pyralis TaxID=7054 RepID=A0A5N4AY49_PHOPY|nr:eukaryotic translation initiation factor 2A-like [Photinus pyralis]XP_031342197.1 eukaryotic translation initiation factor 2A-like [Photinus pyralis]KAB0797863.1 hypothetical protein PPYR_08856 [Photinus pyralis]KAB0802259.1 hypothetical protein PPYR_04445 [Photinus pyralis]